MKSLIFRGAACFAFLLLLAPAQAEFKAALTVKIITPDPLLPVSGGVGASHKTTRKESDLTVRALVLEQDNTRVAIVQADFLGFPSILGNKARALVKGISPENILIGATHTHSAPDAYGFPGGGADIKFLEGVCEKIAAAINESVDKLQPCSLKIAVGEAQGKIAYNYYAPQLYDPRCAVIQAVGKNGKPFATLVNYAIHPEVLASNGGVLSPDLVGPLCEKIERETGGKAIFMNSAQGGMVTADNRSENGDIRTWPEAVRIGELLADQALQIVSRGQTYENPKLYCAARTITFPVESVMLRAIMAGSPLGMAKANGGDLSKVSTQLNLINIGDTQIVTIPGEALPNIGYYLKRKMKGKNNLLFGLTNDAFGYILTKVDFRSFKRYDYVSQTSLGENTGEILIEEILKFVNESPEPVMQTSAVK